MLDHEHIDDMIQRRQQWRQIAQQRWSMSNQRSSTILGRRWQDITETTVENLHALAEMLITAPTEFKLVVSMNQAHVYTNDLILINRMDRMPQLSFKTYSKAQIDRPKNTIQLKHPRHQLRSYLKTINLSTQQKDQLAAFLHNQQDLVRISPALREWMSMPYNRVQDYFFVDHDDMLWLTMLNLVQPGIVRKTMHIIPAK